MARGINGAIEKYLRRGLGDRDWGGLSTRIHLDEIYVLLDGAAGDDNGGEPRLGGGPLYCQTPLTNDTHSLLEGPSSHGTALGTPSRY